MIKRLSWDIADDYQKEGKMYRYRLMLSLLILGTLVLSACQPITPPMPESGPAPNWLIFNRNNSELPGTSVFSLALDPSGAVWIAASNGLARFDGTDWEVYTPDNSGLPNQRVTALTLDESGSLWVGTDNGLAKFDGTNWEVYTTENSDLPYRSVHELAFDQEGTLWVGTGCFFCSGSGGLASFDGETWTGYDTNNSDIPGDHIIGLAIDDQDVKWIGTTLALGRYDGENWTDFSKTEDSTELPIYDTPGIALDAEGDVWISSGSPSGGVAHFDGESWTRYTMDNSGLPSNYADDITVDRDGNKWIGTRDGLAKFDDENWTVFNSENSDLPLGWIWAVLVDNRDNVWIGISGEGLAVYNEGGVDLDLVD